MKLQFEANQAYQLEAVRAVVDVFEGQPLEADDLSVEIESDNPTLISETSVGNHLMIGDTQILKNTHSVQARYTLEKSATRKFEKAKISETLYGDGAVYGPSEATLLHGNNFTVEMETGTGKTYVYLRTIHELYKTYGFKKFIIVVPSVAIKEGVVKNLQITREHFDSLYSKPKLDWYVWDPKKRGQAKQFATNDSLQIMVINIDSFAKADNIINQQSDWGVPAEYIRATNPIVIVDEPQNMETDKRREAIASLNPLCTLRYSATHKHPYNMMYKLDPVKAYDLGLVKKIEVDSVFSEDSFNSAYVYLQKIENKGKNGLFAKIEIDKDGARGLQRQIISVQSGADLYEITKRSIYETFVVDEIDMVEQTVSFTNGKTYYVGQKDESLHEQIVQYQIRRTIENHFDKELRLTDRGIKVLSLFFIDKVMNYRLMREGKPAQGKFAVWFENAYQEVSKLPKYQSLRLHPVGEVHNGYFSVDKYGSPKDTKGDTRADSDTYELIMKDKERLLNPDEPLRFIFSHSALREGWDNPNVFQICTLNETSSEMKKRQEIGRGLRLPVNIDGVRVRDESVNVLTVIANESYEDFARALQSEIEDETGVVFGAGRVKNQRDRRAVRTKKGYQLDENFKQLWDRIKQKTRYSVQFDSGELIEKVVSRLQEVVITSPRITSRRAQINIDESGVSGVVRSDKAIEASDVIAVPDVIGKIQSRTKLTRKTIFEIIDSADTFADILKNPQQFIDEAVRIIDQVMRSLMVDGVKYEKVADEWAMTKFENNELFAYLDNLVEVNDQEKTLYDHVMVDSDIERTFASELEAREDIKFYFKLPEWFKIDTPLGGYNPDWAVVFENDERVYFVAETKGVNDLHDEHLSEAERQRIMCGDRHFSVLEGVEFIAPTNSLTASLSKIL